MALLKTLTHEVGNLSNYDGSTGTPTVVADSAYFSNFGLRSTLSGASDVHAFLSTSIATPLAAAEVHWFKAWMNFDSYVGSEGLYTGILNTENSGSFALFARLIMVSGVVNIRIRTVGDASTISEDFPVSAGWHYYELSLKRSTTSSSLNGKINFRVDGVSKMTVTGFNLFTRPRPNVFRVGQRAGQAGPTGFISFDDVQLGTGPDIVTNPVTNILHVHAGADISTWTASDGATKLGNAITFPQESSGVPGKVYYTFPVGQFHLGTAHRFTGFISPTTLNYPHTDIKWFVKNERTGDIKSNSMTLDNHNDQGGQVQVGQLKPFNIVFYSNNELDQFTVGFENFANNQPGCTFAVDGLGVYIVT